MNEEKKRLESFGPIERPFQGIQAPAAEPRVSLKVGKSFIILRQPKNSNWCWAAVSASVARYYDSTSRVCQCEIVSAVLRRRDCCAGIDLTVCEKYKTHIAKNCDKAKPLEAGLAVKGNINGKPQKPPLRFAEVSAELDSERVVCLREDVAHFVVAVSYLSGTTSVEVADPLDGKFHVVDYSHLRCRCTHSYRTRG